MMVMLLGWRSCHRWFGWDFVQVKLRKYPKDPNKWPVCRVNTRKDGSRYYTFWDHECDLDDVQYSHFEALTFYDDHWDDREKWFANDGLDRMPERVAPVPSRDESEASQKGN